MRPQKAQEIQDEIFKKMPAEKKVDLTSQFFLLGEKLKKLREQDDSRRYSLQNSKDIRKP